MRTLRIGFLAACAALISNGLSVGASPEPVVPATHELAPPATPRSRGASNHRKSLPGAREQRDARENRPTAETVRSHQGRTTLQRATQVYLWAMPLLNVLGMKTGSEKLFEAGYNVLPVWKNRVDAKALVTTPNSDVIYAMSYLDLGKDGPLVFEAAAGLQGILLDFWQRPLPGPPAPGKDYRGDVGFFGPDQGRGGKIPESSRPVTRSAFRKATSCFARKRTTFSFSCALSTRIRKTSRQRSRSWRSAKIYPLKSKASAKPMQFPDASRCPSEPLAAERRECVSVTQALRRQ